MHSVSSLFCLHNCLPWCMNYKLHGQIMSWVSSIYESRLCMAPTSTTIYKLHRCEQAVNEGPYSWSCHACFNFSHLCFRSHWCCMLAVPFTYWVQVNVQASWNILWYMAASKQAKKSIHTHAQCSLQVSWDLWSTQLRGWSPSTRVNHKSQTNMHYVLRFPTLLISNHTEYCVSSIRRRPRIVATLE